MLKSIRIITKGTIFHKPQSTTISFVAKIVLDQSSEMIPRVVFSLDQILSSKTTTFNYQLINEVTYKYLGHPS